MPLTGKEPNLQGCSCITGNVSDAQERVNLAPRGDWNQHHVFSVISQQEFALDKMPDYFNDLFWLTIC